MQHHFPGGKISGKSLFVTTSRGGVDGCRVEKRTEYREGAVCCKVVTEVPWNCYVEYNISAVGTASDPEGSCA